MPGLSRQDSDRWTRDRRLGHRFPIEAPVEYKLIRQQKTFEIGRGWSVNLSSSGVLFEAERPLPPNVQVELSIAWPARLDGVAPLQLCIKGRTVRTRDSQVAVRVLAYDFRTRAVSEASGA
jgi:hypothetical protein